jgi:hypothetical protein
MRSYRNSPQDLINTLSPEQKEIREEVVEPLKKLDEEGRETYFIEHVIVPRLFTNKKITEFVGEEDETKFALKIKQRFEDAKEKNVYPLSKNCLNGVFEKPTKEKYLVKSKQDEIVITGLEKELCDSLAMMRQAYNVMALGLGDNLTEEYMTGEFFHKCGLCSELAGCKFLDIFPSFTLTCGSAAMNRDKGDGFVHHINKCVDWKSCNSGYMRVKEWKKGNSIQVYGGLKKVGGQYNDKKSLIYKCMGFIDEQEAYTKKKQGVNFIVNDYDLKPLKELLC